MLWALLHAKSKKLVIGGIPPRSHDPNGSSKGRWEMKIEHEGNRKCLFFSSFAAESADVVPDQPITEGHLGRRDGRGGDGGGGGWLAWQQGKKKHPQESNCPPHLCFP